MTAPSHLCCLIEKGGVRHGLAHEGQSMKEACRCSDSLHSVQESLETEVPTTQKELRKHLNNVEWPISSSTQASKIRLFALKNKQLFFWKDQQTLGA